MRVTKHSSYRGHSTPRQVSMLAEVVGATLHVGGRKRDVESGAQRRQVLEEDLFLKILGAGRHQHPLTAEDGRDEIRERFAGARARFSEQDPSALENAGDGMG